MISDRELKRKILRSNIERENQLGRGVRPHEVERAVDIAETLFVGQKCNGDASNEAISIVRSGLAE
jgi:hypothetical protein